MITTARARSSAKFNPSDSFAPMTAKSKAPPFRCPLAALSVRVYSTSLSISNRWRYGAAHLDGSNSTGIFSQHCFHFPTILRFEEDLGNP